MVKRTALLLLCVMLLLSGCNSYTAYKDYYTDVESYSEIWELAGFYRGSEEKSPLFPQTIDGLDVIDFSCRYDEQLPLGEGVQLLLSVRYEDEAAFDNELDRIASLTDSCDETFGKSAFDAYALRLGEELASEYCLVDVKNQTVHYVYLKNLPLTEIEFDYSFVPDGYSGYGDIC